MKIDRAVAIATEYVLSLYGFAPPVALAIGIEGLDVSGRCRDGAVIAFECSWDSDKKGLPIKLIVFVDRQSGASEILPDA